MTLWWRRIPFSLPDDSFGKKKMKFHLSKKFCNPNVANIHEERPREYRRIQYPKNFKDILMKIGMKVQDDQGFWRVCPNTSLHAFRKERGRSLTWLSLPLSLSLSLSLFLSLSLILSLSFHLFLIFNIRLDANSWKWPIQTPLICKCYWAHLMPMGPKWLSFFLRGGAGPEFLDNSD